VARQTAVQPVSGRPPRRISHPAGPPTSHSGPRIVRAKVVAFNANLLASRLDLAGIVFDDLTSHLRDRFRIVAFARRARLSTPPTR
jgi:hypothetical protein